MVLNNLCGGGRPLSIAIGTLLVFLVFAGGAGVLSNGGGGNWAYSRDIAIITPGVDVIHGGADVRFTFGCRLIESCHKC